MALTITATVDAATKHVRLSIAGGTPEYVVDAAPAGDRAAYRVRSVYSTVPGDASARVALDGDVPLNVPTQWVVTDRTGAQASSAVLAVASDTPILADALDPSNAVPVVVVSQPPNEWAARSVWWDVLGQREPFASIAPMRLRNGELVLRVDGSVQRAALMAVMQAGHPVVLRSTCPDAVDDLTLLPETVREQLLLDDAPTGPRHVAITYQAVTRELGPYAVDPGRTYEALPVEAATYGTLLGLYVDYRALLAGDPNAGLGPEQVTNGDFSGGLASWSTAWTSPAVTIAAPAGTAVMTCAAGETNKQGVLTALPRSRAVAAPGSSVLHVRGRVRSTAAATVARLELITNQSPAAADYLVPGAIVAASVALPAGPVWSDFTADLATTNAAHDVWSLALRGNGMADGAVVEWDDVSARWRT